MSETDLSRAIQDALALAGVVVARTQAGRVRARGGWVHLAPEGWPDLTGYLPPHGRMLALEVKRPGEKPSPAQVEWRAKALTAGVLAAVVHSPQEALDFAQHGHF